MYLLLNNNNNNSLQEVGERERKTREHIYTTVHVWWSGNGLRFQSLPFHLVSDEVSFVCCCASQTTWPRSVQGLSYLCFMFGHRSAGISDEHQGVQVPMGSGHSISGPHTCTAHYSEHTRNSSPQHSLLGFMVKLDAIHLSLVTVFHPLNVTRRMTVPCLLGNCGLGKDQQIWESVLQEHRW